ncbi:hypothetical protein ACFL1G_02925 [Planctomycetota bacterium]
MFFNRLNGESRIKGNCIMVFERLFGKFQAIVILSILLCFIPACITPTKNATKIEPFNPVKFMADTYSTVTVEDEIDCLEAAVLADAYFMSYISACGAVGTVIDQGDKWEAKTVIGYAAVPFESIFIQKTTGIITCTKGPVVTPPSPKLDINKQ